MLSVLIPVYNFDICPFVRQLHAQLSASNIEFEILIADDASLTEYSDLLKDIEKLTNVRVIYLTTNYGRSKIRNFLASQAHYADLLFVDCDSAIPDDKFISRYLKMLPSHGVICGGRSYENKKPENKSFLLRWLYGIKRETVTASSRDKKPYHSFLSNNFIIDSQIFKNIKFNENLSGYGHEDTLFGIELFSKGINISHIDNPLIHIGLENSEEFIEKTKQGISNLAKIYKKSEYNVHLQQKVKLVRYYHKLKSFRLDYIFILFYRPFRNIIESQIKSSYPNLFIFDLFKLYHFCNELRNR